MEIVIMFIAFVIGICWLFSGPVEHYRGTRPPDHPPGYTRTKKTKRK